MSNIFQSFCTDVCQLCSPAMFRLKSPNHTWMRRLHPGFKESFWGVNKMGIQLLLGIQQKQRVNGVNANTILDRLEINWPLTCNRIISFFSLVLAL